MFPHFIAPSQEKPGMCSFAIGFTLLIGFVEGTGHLIGEFPSFDMRVVFTNDLF